MRTEKPVLDTEAWRRARTSVRTVIMVVLAKARWQGAEAGVGGEYNLFKS